MIRVKLLILLKLDPTNKCYDHTESICLSLYLGHDRLGIRSYSSSFPGLNDCPCPELGGEALDEDGV